MPNHPLLLDRKIIPCGRCKEPTTSVQPQVIDLGAPAKPTPTAKRLEAERSWCDMKQIIDLQPARHCKEERIRAHVLLCRLALVLIPITGTTGR
jgi:hypothetical protein